jgi:hypothetical protein
VLELDSDACMAYSGPAAEWMARKGQIIEDSTAENEQNERLDDEKRPKAETPKPKQTAKDKKEQLKRQAGDLSLWTYYSKFVGAGHILFLALFTTIYVLGANFPR